jgi:hypothetical protein
MGRFRNLATGVVVSVDDASKDERYAVGYEPADVEPAKAPAKKAAAPKSTKK